LALAAGKNYITAMKTTVATIFLLMGIIAASGARADVGDNDGGIDGCPRCRGYGFLMLEEPVGPRNAAMGSAGAALGGYGFGYYNPAQPFFSPAASPYASAEFGRMPGGVNRGGFEAAVFFPGWFGAISFSSSAVDFQTADERGLGATASSGTTSGALSAGYIRGNAALGAAVSAAEDRVWASSNYTAIALSFGLGYKLLDGKMGLGAAWTHGAAWSRGFGEGEPRWHDGRVPAFARAGAAWADTARSIPYTVAADIVYHDEDGTFTAPVGLEAKVLPSISLRLGKRLGFETEILSFGIGFNLGRLSFDAAFTPTVFVDDYEMKWSMGFTYGMGDGWRKKTSVVIEEPIHIKGDVPAEEEPVPTAEESASTDEPELTEESVSTEEEPVSTDEPSLMDETVPTDESTPTENIVPTPQPSRQSPPSPSRTPPPYSSPAAPPP
jgi:hypothetical protein